VSWSQQPQPDHAVGDPEQLDCAVRTQKHTWPSGDASFAR
jgi:hypothetical protein